MNFKTTVILFVLLVGIGGYVFFTQDKDNAPKKPEEHKLVDLSGSADVSKLVITDAAGKKIVLQRSGKDWRLVEPVNALADATEVNALVDSLVSMKSNNQLDSKEASGPKTGLDKPAFTIDLTAKDKAMQVQFGDRLVVGNGVYTKVGGKPEIEVVPADVLDKIDKPASAFRQLKLLDVPSFDIKQFAITSKDGAMKLEKSGVDWSITSPEKIPAEASAVTDLLGQLTGLKATSFVDDSAEGADAMKTPALSVSFSTQAPSTQPAATQSTTQPAMTTIAFGDFDLLKKHVYVKVSDSPFVARLNASALDAFQKKPLDLRDKKVLDVKTEEVSRFTIVTENPSTTKPATKPATNAEVVVMRRKEGGTGVPFLPTTAPATPRAGDKLVLPATLVKKSAWVLGTDGGKTDADDADANALLTALHPLRAEKYLEKNPATQPAKSYRIIVRTESAGGAKSAELVVKLLDRGADQPYVGEYGGLTFEVSRATLSRLLESDYKVKAAGSGGPTAPLGGPGI